ncbi:methyl-accepting chemotaxis protein [Pelomonas sp. APW6]|uniref:Methyl-accepting chemotaxis protein n=1 Tax=Roseateles subflavus TaxID=3053353 RepID=A0ABT7LFN4_9BURK|nr:methyl-accepting chemotaxis protein [Pelomonas sp. APW6]MDL5031663.1 methyl-accepting chemotaxis protein [Pelomonas sp. APW6]
MADFRLSSLSLGTRFALLIAANVLTTVLLLTLAVTSFQALRGDAERTFVAKDVVADILPPPLYLIELRLVLSEAVEGSLSLGEARAALTQLGKDYTTRTQYWESNPPHGLEKWLLGEQHRLGQQLLADADAKVLAPLERSDTAAAMAGLKAIHALYLLHRRSVDQTVEQGNRFAETSMAEFEAARQRGFSLLLALGSAALLLIGINLWTLKRSLMRYVQEARDVAQSVAEGDLRLPERAGRHPTSAGSNELRRLQGDIHGMVVQLRTLIASVQQGASLIDDNSRSISQANAELSARAQLAVYDLEAADEALKAMGGKTSEGAASAQQADQLTRQAAALAERSSVDMQGVVSTMQDIEQGSRRIADITGVIDGIAFQTNILALNAAVEAARAGEAGRGFAVVAAEVRHLAQRSAGAAQEIKQLIQGSSEQVERGVAAVQATRDTIAGMVSQVQQVTGLIQRSSLSQQEQLEAITALQALLDGIAGRIRDNSSVVDQTAADSEELQAQAISLHEAAQAFRL